MKQTPEELFARAPVAQAFFTLTLPSVVGKVVTIFYNLADTYFIAQTGDTALVAGVSLVGPVFTVMIALGDIFGLGGSSLIARLLGQGRADAARRINSFCFWAAAGLGAVLAALLLAFDGPVLAALGAGPDTLESAGEYYRWIALGAPFVLASMVPLNLLRSEGLANWAVAGSILGTVVNILLDPLFILVLRMGAAGAAIATVLGNVASVALSVWVYLCRSRLLSISPRLCRLSGRELKQILAIGLPASVTNLTQSLSLALTNRFLAPFGTDRVAAMGIVMKVNSIAFMLLVGFAFGAQPLFGYNYGAGNRARLRRVMGFSYGFLCGLSALLALGMGLCAPALVRLFLDDGAVVQAGAQMLRFQLAGLVFAAAVLVSICVFQATGKALGAFLLSLCRQGLVFTAVILAGSALAGYTGVIAAQPVSDALTALLALGLLKASLLRETARP